MDIDFKRLANNLLMSWAKWSVSHGINIDYPKSGPLMSDYVPRIKTTKDFDGVRDLSDADALLIDAYVSQLKHIEPKAREIAVLYYLRGYGLHEMRPFGFGESRAREGKSFVIGHIIAKAYNLLIS